MAHFLEKEENSPVTAILVGAGEKHVRVIVVKAGRIEGSTVVDRKSDLGLDIQNALLSFTNIEVLPAKEKFGETPTTGVDLAFFYLDLLVEAKIRCLRTPSATLVWLYQAESREFESMEAVFQAITVSMLQTQVPRVE